MFLANSSTSSRNRLSHATVSTIVSDVPLVNRSPNGAPHDRGTSVGIDRESPRLARSAVQPRGAVIAIEVGEILRQFVTQRELAGRTAPAGINEAASLHFQGKRSWPYDEFGRSRGHGFQQSDGACHLGRDLKSALDFAINHVDLRFRLLGSAQMGL